LLPHVDKLLDGSLVVVVPVFMKADGHIGVPCRKNAFVIVRPAIGFEKDQVPAINRTNGRGDVDKELPQWTVPCFGAAVLVRGVLKPPVGFVDQVVAADPGFVRVAVGELFPKSDGLVAVANIFPKRRPRGIAVGDRVVVTLPPRSGVEVENEIDPV
jgi:hypothetical protein